MLPGVQDTIVDRTATLAAADRSLDKRRKRQEILRDAADDRERGHGIVAVRAKGRMSSSVTRTSRRHHQAVLVTDGDIQAVHHRRRP